jgi:hypothetical protein
VRDRHSPAGNLASATELSCYQAMYREAGMSKWQKRSATGANRSPSGKPEAKRLPDRRGAQDQACGTASAQSCRRFRLAHSEIAERIRAFDWASTETGPISDWFNDVQTAATICADIASAQQAEFASALEVHTRRAAAGSLASARSRRSMTPLKATATDRKISQPRAKSPEHARSVRITTAAQTRHGCAGQMLMARAAHLKRGST